MSSNPDNKVTTTTFETFGIAIPLGIMYGILLTILFIYKDSIPLFSVVLWIIFPIIAYLISSTVNIINQYITCKTTDAGKAFLGGVPTLISILLAMVCGNISYCRIPITSVFAPLIINQDADILSNNSKQPSITEKSLRTYCCPNKMTLSEIENLYPQLKGISMGFYVLFGVLFGSVFGSGLSSIC